METTPQKTIRRHYKAEYEKMCAYADELVTDIDDVRRNRDHIAEALVKANTETRYYWRNFVGMGIVAIVAILALVIVLAR